MAPFHSKLSASSFMLSPWKRIGARVIIAAIALLVGVAYGSSYLGWPIYLELLSHFQVQYFGISLILLGGLGLLRPRQLVYVSIFMCVLLAVPVLSWYVPSLPESRANHPGADVRLFVANVNTQNRRYEAVLNLVKSESPDVAIFIEVDEAWKRQLDRLGDRFLDEFGRTQPGNFGILVYSKYPLQNPQLHFFGSDQHPSVEAEIVLGDRPVTLLATHPLPPVKPVWFEARNRQIEGMGQYLRDSFGLEGEAIESDKLENDEPESDRPTIVAGDFNITMWSPYYRRLMAQTQLRNTRQGFGILPTWPTAAYKDIPTGLRSLFRIPIDHCLISSAFEVANMRVGATTGSDHRPLIVDLRLVIPDR